MSMSILCVLEESAIITVRKSAKWDTWSLDFDNDGKKNTSDKDDDNDGKEDKKGTIYGVLALISTLL